MIELPVLRHLQATVAVAIAEAESQITTLTTQAQTWREAFHRQKASASLYRHLWLAAERELRKFQVTLAEETRIDLKVGNAVGKELEALSQEQEKKAAFMPWRWWV